MISDKAGSPLLDTSTIWDKADSPLLDTERIWDKAGSPRVEADAIPDKVARVETDAIPDKVARVEADAIPDKVARVEADAIPDKVARVEADAIPDKVARVETDAIPDKVARVEADAIPDKVARVEADAIPNKAARETDTISDKWHREVEIAGSFGKGFSSCVTDLIDHPGHFALEAGYSVAAGAIVTALSHSPNRAARIAGGIAKGIGIVGIGAAAYESALPFVMALDGEIARSSGNMVTLNKMANTMGELAGHLPTTLVFGGMGMKAMSLAHPAKYEFALARPLKSMPELLATGTLLKGPQYGYLLEKSVIFE